MTYITSYFDKVIRDIKFSQSGYDSANTRWTDVSGNNLHIPHVSGAPSFGTTFGGINCWEHGGDNANYSEHECPTNTFTAVFSFYSDSNALAYWLYDADNDTYAVGDHDTGDGSSQTWTARDTRYFRLSNATPSFSTFGGVTAGTAPNITEAQWNIATMVYSPSTKTMTLRINDETIYEGAVASWLSVRFVIATIRRIGYLTTSGTPLVGSFGFGQYGEISGNVFVDQDANFNNWIAAAKTHYGIT